MRSRAEVWLYRRLRPLVIPRAERTLGAPGTSIPERRRTGLPAGTRRVLVGVLVAGTRSVGAFFGGQALEAHRADVAEQEEAKAEASCLARADDLRRELVADRRPNRSYFAASYAGLERQIERAKAGKDDVGYLAAAIARQRYEPEDIIFMSCVGLGGDGK